MIWPSTKQLFMLVSILAFAGCGSGGGVETSPNVILIVIDTLRADHLSGYGYHRDTTPVLDALMEEGVRFDTAIAPGSWSPPSQISIITGVNPYLHGVNDFGYQIRSEIDPLGAILKENGYSTGLFSSHRALHTSVRRSAEGMDHQLIEMDSDRRMLAGASEFARSATTPFFLYICLTAPHAPYDRYPEDYDTRFFTDTPPGGGRKFPFSKDVDVGIDGIPVTVRIGDHQDVGYYVNRYDRAIRFVDSLVGEFWEALRDAGVADNTLLVITSDHGEGLGDHGAFAHEYFLYDFLVRVPLIVRYPERVRGGQVWSQQAALLDIVPTILGLVGISVPEVLEGRDLSEYLVAGSRPAEPPVITGSYIARGKRRFMVRTQQYKMIFDENRSRGELYDLLLDPEESQNLIDARGKTIGRISEYATLKGAMAETIEKYRAAEAGNAERELSPAMIEDLRALGYAE